MKTVGEVTEWVRQTLKPYSSAGRSSRRIRGRFSFSSFRLIAPNPIGAETRYSQSDGFLFFGPVRLRNVYLTYLNTSDVLITLQIHDVAYV